MQGTSWLLNGYRKGNGTTKRENALERQFFMCACDFSTFGKRRKSPTDGVQREEQTSQMKNVSAGVSRIGVLDSNEHAFSQSNLVLLECKILSPSILMGKTICRNGDVSTLQPQRQLFGSGRKQNIFQ